MGSIPVRYCLAAALAGAIAFGAKSHAPLFAQSTAAEALTKARALERLADQPLQVARTARAPGFVVDPAWPKQLPHNWIIGDVGGITVDQRDHIWVYHRPRSVGSQDSGRKRRERQADQRARTPAALWADQRLLHAGAVDTRVQSGGEIAEGVGRSG